jgi:hypothetical protein
VNLFLAYKTFSQTEMSFSKTKGRQVKWIPSGGWYQWEGGGYRKVAKEGEYGRNIMYENGKMRPVKTILRGENGG